ncbi:MAG: type II toxin-antitoxin system RelE/ParE family toxin [Cyclobacteriaceae bacterium]|nr:type II toxin-antitoxin system RelE/ParE family toxin [Cyclobacteriaceae bacterium]
MSYKIYYTDNFEKQLKKLSKKYPSIKNDFQSLLSSLKTDPRKGQALGKDCYKIRMSIASKRKGKSGGSRVIYSVKVIANSVYLLSIYDKSEKENIKDSELDFLLSKAGLL